MNTTTLLPHRVASIVLTAIVSLAAGTTATAAPALPVNGDPTPIDTVGTTITIPGAYCLTKNLTVGAAEFGIRVEVDNVTIDLGGYVLTGPGAAGASTGIDAAGRTQVEIFNGKVREFGIYGIHLGDFGESRNVAIQQCVQGGLRALNFASVQDCSFQGNGGSDLYVGNSSIVRNCRVQSIANENAVRLGRGSLGERIVVYGGSTAIRLEENSRLRDCTAQGFVVYGIVAAKAAVLEGCIVQGSSLGADIGILLLGSLSRARDCVVNGNVYTGFQVSSECDIQDCSVGYTRWNGFRTYNESRLRGCLAFQCNSSNDITAGGAMVGERSEVIECIFTDNKGYGLRYDGAGGVIRNCSSFDNTLGGFQVLSGTLLQENWASKNDGQGILVAGDRAVLRDNVADENFRGIQVLGLGTLLTGNRAVGNAQADFDIRFGNPTGPINQHSGTIGGSVPQANFKTPF